MMSVFFFKTYFRLICIEGQVKRSKFFVHIVYCEMSTLRLGTQRIIYLSFFFGREVVQVLHLYI